MPAAYLQESAELAYAGNVHVAEGRTVDAGHPVIEAGATRSLVYTGSHPRPGEEHHPRSDRGTGPGAAAAGPSGRPTPTPPSWQRAELRRTGDVAGARAVRLEMPDRPSDRQLAPWEAVLAQALQQDEPERTALEEMQAAQDSATNTGHLLRALGGILVAGCGPPD